ncbi:proline rich protein 5MeD [Metarhizium guizhouense ARSEF 977]|uniref:Proline rich protein 5MeD n=1 Tax=Metarhizium guizhouense (strain ARSEF 977) TaxID=1276136 RepID=A0A0B4H4R4_METGA|nr:proline rich protein 5MeD [Metarhizium guizhouense ARSEF 977]
MITIFVLVALTGLTFANPLDLQPREDVKEDHFDLCRLLGCHRPHTVTRTLVYTITSTAISSATATATITTTLDCSPSASTTLRTTATTSDFTSTGTSATTATSPDTTASIDTTSTDTAAPTDITTSTDTTTSTDITASTDITSADTTAAPTTLTDSSTDVSGSTGATTSTGVTISTNTTLTGVTTSSDITSPTYTASTTDATTSADTTTSTEAATSGTTTAEATDTTTAAASTSSSSSTTALLSPLSTLVPFNCSADAFFIQDRLLLSVNLQTGERKTLSSSVGGSSARVSAIGFNPLDNFIYGLQNKTVVRIGHDGALQRVAEGDMAANAGDVDSNGQLYYTAGGRAWARVDLKPGSARYGQVVARGTSDSSALPGNLAAGDWAFTPAAPGYLHSVAVDANGVVYLVRWDLATHRWEVRHEGLPSFGIQGSVFGAVVATSDGVLYASHNGSGAVLRIPLDDPKDTRKLKVLVPRAAFSDGCRCASMPDVAV